MQFCNEYAVPRDIMDNVKKVTPQDIVCSQVFILFNPSHLCMLLIFPRVQQGILCCFLCNIIWQKNGGVMLKEEDVAVSNVKIDLTRGKHNPLERYSMKIIICFNFLISYTNVLFPSLFWCMFWWQHPLFQGTTMNLLLHLLCRFLI